MKKKYLQGGISWHCRNGGGLFLGLNVHFPITIWVDGKDEHEYRNVIIYFGFLVFSVWVSINWGYKKTNYLQKNENGVLA